MDGFKDTFSHLYQNDLTNGSSTDPGCSAGNGADSDSLIVRLILFTEYKERESVVSFCRG